MAYAELRRTLKDFSDINFIAPKSLPNMLKIAWELRKTLAGHALPQPEDQLERWWNETILKGLENYAQSNKYRNAKTKADYKKRTGWKGYA